MKSAPRLLLAAFALGFSSLSVHSAPLGSHTWDFTEAFSSADGTIQFIELRECCGGAAENGLPGHTLSSIANAWPIPGGPLPGSTANKHYLIATSAFAALPGAPVPDAIVPSGMVPFFATGGDTLTYVPWDTWVFGAVPTDGVNSLKRDGTVSANNPTNYAGGTGSVIVPPPFCDGSDGSLASCPCANPGSADTGCDIPQATGGVGLTVLAQNTSPNGATLQGSGFPTMGAPTAIVIRSSLSNLPSPFVFGDGLRCINDASGLVRLAASNASGGISLHTFGNGAMAGGGTKHYQLWFRSTPSTFCDASAAFNLSNGRSLTW